MLQAIVANIPGRHARLVHELWDELRVRFDMHSELTEEFPHFSLHVSGGYDEVPLVDRLRVFAARHARLRVRAAGLGLFTGEHPVLYVPLVRNPRLNAFHGELWQAVEGLGQDVRPYYSPERWIPHVTLAHDDLDPYDLGQAMGFLMEQQSDWEFEVSTLSVLETHGAYRRVVSTVRLSGPTGA